jgi:hypothetical protein
MRKPSKKEKEKLEKILRVSAPYELKAISC